MFRDNVSNQPDPGSDWAPKRQKRDGGSVRL
jgi:hypothetical protein